MKSLASSQGRRDLRWFLRQRPLLAFDFDGTLVALQRHPDLVRLPQNVLLLLRTLGQILPTAVVSGRRRSDLRSYIPDRSIHLIGNHGIEGIECSPALLETVRSEHRYHHKRTRAVLNECPLFSRCWIENKSYSFTVHYAGRSRHADLHRTLSLELCRAPHPPRIFTGHRCTNVLPASSVHKGDAVLHLLRKTDSSCAIFIGDDTTDEDVFAMRDRRILGITIGDDPSAAAYHVPSQRHILPLLQTLLRELKLT